MKKTHSILCFLFFVMLSLPVTAKECGTYACLNFKQMPEGYYEVNFESRHTAPIMCYARWDNSRIVRRVQSHSSPFYLRSGYPPAGLSWRCDPEDSCPAWMSMAGLCQKQLN